MPYVAGMEAPDRLVKTSVYVPANELARLHEIAARRGVSSAALIRTAISTLIGSHRPPPRGGFLGRNTGESHEQYD